IPFAGVMLLQGFVGEDSRRTDLDQIAAEFALQDAVFVTPEVNVVVRGEDVEIAPASVVALEADTAIALDAALHLVIDEQAEILIAVGPLLEAKASVSVPGHHRHILQMAFAALVAHRAIVRMIDHQPFDYARAKLPRLLIFY